MDITTLGIKIDASSALTASQSLEKLDKSASAADGAVTRLKSAFAGLAAAIGVRELAQASDSYANINAQLKISTGSASQAAVAYGEVLRIARSTGQSLEQVSTVYRRLSNVSGDIGISQKQVAITTESVARALAISGVSAQSAEAALTQFGQGLAAGTLRGEELNSVLEQSPRLAQALAEGLGVPIGALKELAATGAITSEAIIQALNNQGKALEREFAQLPLTTGRALTNLGNSFINITGTIENSTGVFRAAAVVINTLADNLGVVASAAAALATVYAVRVVSGIAAATLAKIAATSEARKLAAAELAAAAAAQSAAASMAAAGLQTSALAAANTRLAAAQAAVAVSSRAAAAVGLLGGPIGIITTALTLGAAAWAAWGSSAVDNAEGAAKALERTTADVNASLDKQLEKLRERNRIASTGLPQLGQEGGEAGERVVELQNRMQQIRERSGIFSSINESAASELLKQTGLELAGILKRLQDIAAEQKKLAEFSDGTKASKWLEKYATDAEKLRAELLKAQKELGTAFTSDIGKRIADRFTNREALDAEVRDKRAEASQIRAGGSSARDALFDRAQERRDRGLSPRDQEDQARRQASNFGARATLRAGEALSSLRAGDLTRAQRLSEEATKLAERAVKAADKIADDDVAAREFESLGRLQEKIASANAGLKDAEADQIAEAQKRVDSLITALTTPVTLSLDTTEAEKRMNALIAQFKTLGGISAGTPTAPALAPQGGSITMGNKTVSFDSGKTPVAAQPSSSTISWTRELEREAKRTGR